MELFDGSVEDSVCVWHVYICLYMCIYVALCVCVSASVWVNVTILYICDFARLVVCHSAREQPQFRYTKLSRGGTVSVCVFVLVGKQGC